MGQIACIYPSPFHTVTNSVLQSLCMRPRLSIDREFPDIFVSLVAHRVATEDIDYGHHENSFRCIRLHANGIDDDRARQL